MNIVEIFDSIEGEGRRSGRTATFIRFAGCNLRCSYCDTTYALFGEPTPCLFTEMSVDEILSHVNPNYRRVTLTGGEPLIQPHISDLIKALLERDTEVNIETNGTVNTEPFRLSDNVFFTIDYKLPSSGAESHMKLDNYFNLNPDDVVKFVIGSDEDLAEAISITSSIYSYYSSVKTLQPLLEKLPPRVYYGAVAGAFSLSRITDAVIATPSLSQVTVQVQLHKILNVN